MHSAHTENMQREIIDREEKKSGRTQSEISAKIHIWQSYVNESNFVLSKAICCCNTDGQEEIVL